MASLTIALRSRPAHVLQIGYKWQNCISLLSNVLFCQSLHEYTTKQERERKLLLIRIETIIPVLSTLLSEMQAMKRQTAHNNDFGALIMRLNSPEFIRPSIIAFEPLLSDWSGVNTDKIRDDSDYRPWFRDCKNWFDQRKARILSASFYVPALKMIKRVCPISFYCTPSLFEFLI